MYLTAAFHSPDHWDDAMVDRTQIRIRDGMQQIEADLGQPTDDR